jgi:aldehyde dehydrogenase (NAD+)
LFGGETDITERYISPTLVGNISENHELLKAEIFGPILPILCFKSNEEALQMIEKNANPLSLYVFTESNKNAQLYINKVAFGGGCVNDTLLHLANPALPFGGVNSSGMGKYHGKFSFDTFTQQKSIVQTTTRLDILLKYPPYKNNLKWIKRLMG